MTVMQNRVNIQLYVLLSVEIYLSLAQHYIILGFFSLVVQEIRLEPVEEEVLESKSVCLIFFFFLW